MKTIGKVIAIVGAPRSGKSYLAKKLAHAISAKLFSEGEAEDFPERIKEDIAQNIRPLERVLWFRNKFVKDYLEAIKLKENGEIVVTDVFWASVFTYVPVLTEGFERDLCEQLLNIDVQSLPLPDKIIFLRNSIESTKEFIKLGGRDFDSNDSFISEVVVHNQKAHDGLFTQERFGDKLVIIDRENLDFSKDEDFESLLEKIK